MYNARRVHQPGQGRFKHAVADATDRPLLALSRSKRFFFMRVLRRNVLLYYCCTRLGAQNFCCRIRPLRTEEPFLAPAPGAFVRETLTSGEFAS